MESECAANIDLGMSLICVIKNRQGYYLLLDGE